MELTTRDDTQDPPTNLTPRGLSKALNIALQRQDYDIGPLVDGLHSAFYSWQFYDTPKGKNANCNVYRAQPNDMNKEVREVWAATIKNPGDDPNDTSGVLSMWPGGTYPGGTYTMTVGGKDCQYMNNGNGNTGSLWCEGEEIACTHEHAALGNPSRRGKDGGWIGCDGRAEENGGSPVYQLPFITCDGDAKSTKRDPGEDADENADLTSRDSADGAPEETARTL
jgi:hypothetical protein